MQCIDRPYIEASHKQIAQMSWWPRVHTWEAGTYDLGCWTTFAEMWFQHRLDRIRSHEAKPKSVSGWRNDLKSAMNAKKVRDAVANASEQFVDAKRDLLFS